MEPDRMVGRTIFCSGCGRDGPAPPRPRPPGSARASALPVELLATFYCRADGAWSMAVIRAASHEARLYGRGMRVAATDAVVMKVLPKRVYLRRGAAVEVLDLERALGPDVPDPSRAAARAGAAAEPASGGIRCSGAQCTIDRAFVERTLANPLALSATARVSPTGAGLRFDALRPDSPLAQLGFRAGDVLKAVHGNELSNVQTMIGLLIKLQHA